MRIILSLLLAMAWLSASAYGGLPAPESEHQPEAVWRTATYWDDLTNVTPTEPTDAQLERSLAEWLALCREAGNADVVGESAQTLACSLHSRQDDVLALLRRYLEDPDSGLYDPELAVRVIEAFASEANPDEAARARARYLASRLRLNLPGRQLPDFVLTRTDGSVTILRALLGGAPATVVLYDPDCDTCHEYLDRLAATAPATRVVVVDVAQMPQAMAAEEARYPAGWQFVSAAVDVEDEDIVYIETFPTVLLVGPDGSIVKKLRP